MKKNIKIAITGGIGSGKSVALQFLKEQGFETISADEIAKSFLDSEEVKKKILEAFPFCLDEKKLGIDKQKLAEKVFGSPENVKILNNITHPLVLNKIFEIANNAKGAVFIEIPLLFEAGYESFFDFVIVILRDKNLRIKSVIKRSNLSDEQVEERIANQIDYDEKDFNDFYVITNNLDLDEFKKQLSQTVKNILEK